MGKDKKRDRYIDLNTGKVKSKSHLVHKQIGTRETYKRVSDRYRNSYRDRETWERTKKETDI